MSPCLCVQIESSNFGITIFFLVPEILEACRYSVYNYSFSLQVSPVPYHCLPSFSLLEVKKYYIILW
jgi:hypothetical protein